VSTLFYVDTSILAQTLYWKTQLNDRLLLFTDPSGNVTQPGFLSGHPLPQVDLGKFMVVGIVLASHSNGCTGVTITRAEIVEKQLLIGYHERKMREGVVEACTLSFATAFHFVAVPASALPVRFEAEGDASNPSIERTFQWPLRALWLAAHVKR
jgi:hypothetical protein